MGADEPLLLENPVGLLDGVGIDPQPRREYPPGGELVAILDDSAHDGALEVEHDLYVDGNACLLDKVVKGYHGLTSELYYKYNTV